MYRPFAGATKDHYTFAPTKVGTLNYISAVGSSQEFAYHKNRDIGTALSHRPFVTVVGGGGRHQRPPLSGVGSKASTLQRALFYADKLCGCNYYYHDDVI